MTEQRETCADKIEAQWLSRWEDFALLLRAMVEDPEDLTPDDVRLLDSLGVEVDPEDPDAMRESAGNVAAEYGYGMTRTTCIRIDLSGGGPADYVKIEMDESGTVLGGSYHYLDWFDGARRELTADEAQTVADFYSIPEYDWTSD